MNDSWISFIPISIGIDGLDIGIYNYILEITDGIGNYLEDPIILW